MDALREIHRVLQPTGVFGMVWNIEDCKLSLSHKSTMLSRVIDNAPRSWDIHPGWEKVMNDVIWTFDDEKPRFRHEKWKAIFDEQNESNPILLHFADPLFGLPIGENTEEFETWLPKDAIWGRLRTLSQLAILEGSDLQKVKKTFEDAIDSPETVKDEQGRVAVHGRTYFAWTSRIPGEPLKSGG